MNRDNKALASAGSKSKFLLLEAILILRRRMTLHKPKLIVVLCELLCCIRSILGVRTEKHRVDKRTEEPVCLQEVRRYLRRVKQRHDYSQCHVSGAEFYNIPVVDRLTTLVATHSIVEVLYKPIGSSLDELIVRVPVLFKTFNSLSTSLAMVLVYADACWALEVRKSITKHGGIMKHNTHEILSHFGDLSLKMYLVGGFLRDMLIGKESKDVDLTTPHSPEEVQKVLKDHKPAWFHGIYSTNERHRTVVVLYFNGFSTIKLEITQFRIDLESEGHKANTKAASTLEEDLARRDFTINAIAGDTKKLYDPFGGEADCKARVLRCVTRPTGETGVNDDGSLYDIMERPMVRFKEDTLRVLRLFRFEARLKFKIDPDTLSDALECGVGDDISIERIRDEITATFEVPDADVSRFLERLKQLGVLKRCLPALYESADFCDSLEQSPVYHKEGDVWTHIKKVVHEAKPDAENRWIALLHDIAKPRTAYPKVNKDTGKLEPFASYHKHDKMGESMIRNEVGPHLKLNGTADGKYGDLIDKAALCCRYHLKIYQWSTNVGQPKKDANGNEIKDKDGNTVLIKVKPSHIVTVQAEMGKYLHLLKNLAEADHMGRPVQKGVEQFFKPVEKKDIDHHKIPLLNGKKLMKVFKLEPGPIVGLYHDKAMELQRSNPGITEEELLSMVRKQEGEINNENK